MLDAWIVVRTHLNRYEADGTPLLKECKCCHETFELKNVVNDESETSFCPSCFKESEQEGDETEWDKEQHCWSFDDTHS